MKITSEMIDVLFPKCFFKDEEIIKGRPTSNYVMVSSPILYKPPIVFSANHLQEIKTDILNMLDSIPNIDKGVSIETLRDFEWGNDDDLNKLILMGSSILSLDVTSIEVNNKKIFYLKRDKSHDLEDVKGLPKENIPETKEELIKAYTEEEKEIIRKNGERITQELNTYLSTINRGLGFFGIIAELDVKSRNKLNFYDKDNNLLYERVFLDTDGIIDLEGLLGQRLLCEFKDLDGNTITYLYDKRHIFSLVAPKDKKIGINIELEGEEGNYQSIEIRTTNANDEYIIKSLNVRENYLSYELENAFGPYGNYVDGATRKMKYHSSLHPQPYFSLIEKTFPHDGSYLYCDENGFKFFGEEPIVSYDNRRQFDRLAINIVAHPRNREALNYILEEFDRFLPNMKEFAINNFYLLKYCLAVEYIDDPIMDIIMNKAINHACDFQEKVSPKK